MTITETQRGFEVKFQYNPNIITDIKGITGSWYRGADKTWVIPKHREREVEMLGKKYHANGGSHAQVITMEQEFGAIEEMPDLDIELPMLKRKPYPFQEKGIAYNRVHKRTIIGDQPGLGKTLQAIATVVSFGLNEKGVLNAGPVLIICPSSLKMNWQKEWMEVAGRKAMILSDNVKKTWMKYYEVGMCDVFITNYESLKKYFVQTGWKKPTEGTFKMNMIPFKECVDLFKTIIIDESHRCKDGTTQQTKFVMGIARGKEFVYELTGTPVVNQPKDLISQLHIIDSLRDVVSHIRQPLDKHGKATDWSGYNRFINRYCGGGNGATNMEELSYRLKKFCFYRREKSEVLTDLPPKVRQVVLTEISNRAEYKHAENQFVNYLKEVKGCSDSQVKKKLRGEVMVKMGILKNISARGKMHQVREFVDDIIESGEKIILFCHLKEIAAELKRIYPLAVSITGDDSMEDRNRAVTQFQTLRNVQVIICSIKAAGVGLTLTASSRVAFIEFPWTFADCEQCEDRAHRIGQNDSVQCSYFLGEHTIDRYCYELIQRKKTIAQTITGASDDVPEEIIDELLNLFNKH